MTDDEFVVADTELARGYAWSDESATEADAYVLTWRETLATPAGRLFIAAVVVLLAAIGWWWWVVGTGRSAEAPPPTAGTVPYVVPASVLAPPTPAAVPPAPSVAAPTEPPVTRADPDKRFLAMMTDAGIPIIDARLAVSGAREVCQYLAAGHTEQDAIEKSMENNPLLTEPAATAFVTAATQVYCHDGR